MDKISASLSRTDVFTLLLLFIISFSAVGLFPSGAFEDSFEGLTGEFEKSALSVVQMDSEEVNPELFSDTRKPETVILIDIDTLRADHVGYYGYERNTTPNLDRFARNNIAFENAVTPAEWTHPADASVFTSTFKKTHGADGQREKVPEKFRTIPEVLRDNGYRTRAFTGGWPVDRSLGYGQGFDKISNHSRHERNEKRNFDANFNRTINYLENNSGNRSFVFVHGYDVHAPYGYSERYMDEFAGNYSGPLKDLPNPIYPAEVEHRSGNPVLVRGNRTITLDEEDIRYIRAGYDSDVKETDRYFGRFIDNLKDSGRYKDSMIIVYSSHGENLANKRYRFQRRNVSFGHWYLHDHNIRVPLIIKMPGSDSKQVQDPVSAIDIAPTIYDAVDAKISEETVKQLQGETLLPVIEGVKSTSMAFSQAHGDLAIRGENWKYISTGLGEDELYRLGPYENGTDSGERPIYRLVDERKVNISEHPELQSYFQEEAREWRQRIPKDLEDQMRQPVSSNEETDGILPQFFGPKMYSDLDSGKYPNYLGESFMVKDIEKDVERGKKVETLRGSSGELDVRLEVVRNVSKEYAKKYITSESNSVISIYRGIAPYTDRAGAERCETSKMPRLLTVDRDTKRVLKLYSDSEGSYGECRSESALPVTIKFGYCEEMDAVYRADVRGAEYPDHSVFTCARE